MRIRTFKGLESVIQQNVQEALQNEVGDVLKGKLAKTFDTVAYGAYDPVEYERNDDLNKPENIAITPTRDGSGIELRNTIEGENGNIADVLEQGGVEAWGEKAFDRAGRIGEWTEERPTYKTFADELRNTGLHMSLLKSALRKRGFNIK